MTLPPSREPGQAGVSDADEPERWPQECESVTTSWRMSRLLADRTRYQACIEAAEQERDDYKEATADVLTWMRSWLDAARESHEGAKPEDKAFWVSVADNRRTAIRQVQNIEARQSPRRIRALLEVPHA